MVKCETLPKCHTFFLVTWPTSVHGARQNFVTEALKASRSSLPPIALAVKKNPAYAWQKVNHIVSFTASYSACAILIGGYHIFSGDRWLLDSVKRTVVWGTCLKVKDRPDDSSTFAWIRCSHHEKVLVRVDVRWCVCACWVINWRGF